jgi:3-oxoadipate enol-lactonase
MPRLKANDVDVYYELHGPGGAEVVVLNNGVFMSTASWAFQIPELARRYRVLAYDMRGQGQSDHPPGPYSMEQHAEDLVSLMDALDVGRAHLVGTSYGGELNLVMGLRHKERCRSLVVIASVSHSEPLLAAIIGRWRLGAGLGDGRAFFRIISADVYSEAFMAAHPELLMAAEERSGSMDLAAAVRLLDSFARFDVRAELAGIRLPTCIVSAELDALKPRRYGEILHRAIAGSEFHVVPGAGHGVVLERPGEINTIVMGFLARHEDGGTRPDVRA